MSIIVAVVSNKCGVVASDGRRFNSGRIDIVTKAVIDPVTIATDAFDKTFELYGGKLIGTFCGLLEFCCFGGDTNAGEDGSIRLRCNQLQTD